MKLTTKGFRKFLADRPRTAFTANREYCGAASYAKILTGDPSAWIDLDAKSFRIPKLHDATIPLPRSVEKFVRAFYKEAGGDEYYQLSRASLLDIYDRVNAKKGKNNASHK